MEHPLIIPGEGSFSSQELQEGQLYRLSLPVSVLLSLQRTDFGDLCLFNAEGQPLLRGFVEAAARQETHTVSITRLYPLWGAPEEKAASIRLSIDILSDEERLSIPPMHKPAGKVLKGYVVELPARDVPFEELSFSWDRGNDDVVRFSLEGGNDLVNWRSLSHEVTLVRLEGPDGTLENKTAQLSIPHDIRYLRLLFKAGQEPAAIRQINAFSRMHADSSLHNTIAVRRILSPSPDHPEVADYELQENAPSSGLPLVALETFSSRPGQYAHVRLLTGAPPNGTLAPFEGRKRERRALSRSSGGLSDDSSLIWKNQGVHTLFTLLHQGVEIRNPPLPLSGAKVSRIRIERLDGQPFTDPPSLVAHYRPIEVWFLAQGPQPYTLRWGGERAATGPSSDIDNLRRLSGGKVIEAVLDPHVLQPSPPSPIIFDTDEEGEDQSGFFSGHWQEILLWSVLVVGVLLLGFMSWRLSRTMREK